MSGIAKGLALSLLAKKAGKTAFEALSDHSVLKVAAVDPTVYASIAAIDAAYGGVLSVGGAAVAFDGYPAGAAVVVLKQDGGAGTPVTHEVLRRYHGGLTVVSNTDGKRRTWTGSDWQVDSVAPGDVSPLLAPTGMRSPWGNNDVAVYLGAGQSNSHGHGATMAVGDRITTALANVKCLKTTHHKNLTFTDVTWEGYTSLGECNLGGTNVDHLHCAATEFARSWQAHINDGNAMGLPDLYVIRMSTGGQGFYPGSPIDRWSFTRNASDTDSLFPRYMKTLRLAIANLRAAGKVPRIIVQDWNQWEAEADASANTATLFGKDYAAAHFLRLIQSIRDATGCPELKLDFYYPLATTYPSANVLAVRKALESVVAMDPQHLGFNDVRSASHYTGVTPGFGVFQADNVHYNITTLKWFAQQQFDRVLAGDKGVPAGMWPHGTRPLSQVESDITALQASVASAIASTAPTKWQAVAFTGGANIETAPGLSFDVGAASHTVAARKTGSQKSIFVSKDADPFGFLRATAFVSDSMSGELIIKMQAGSTMPRWLGAAFRVSGVGVVGGGFNSVPYSYLAANLDATGALNCWILFNSTLDIAADRRFSVAASSFINALPTTGAHWVRIALQDDRIYLQYSTNSGSSWTNCVTQDNTAAGTPGRAFTYDATRHASLTGIISGGGVAGLVMGLGSNSLRTSANLDGFEFNPLP